ncbi:protocadherin-23 [Clarias magur]|uniref:Protocadherin-23 n=1 Tax=Clarias magur TaxID=1594786 RepID=A0A8J4TTU2_CLAMG|nr:protocadherin-23 [Clarias magur]
MENSCNVMKYWTLSLMRETIQPCFLAHGLSFQHCLSGQSIPDSNPGLATLLCLSTGLCDCLRPDDVIIGQHQHNFLFCLLLFPFPDETVWRREKRLKASIEPPPVSCV